MKIAIIGLGLIGGSIARRLRGFHDCTIAAYNRTAETLLLAKQDGAIDEGYSDPYLATTDYKVAIPCFFTVETTAFQGSVKISRTANKVTHLRTIRTV